MAIQNSLDGFSNTLLFISALTKCLPFLQGIIRAGCGLEKGLKFAIAPRKIPTAEIVAAVEESISQLNDDRRHLVRAEVTNILR